MSHATIEGVLSGEARWCVIEGDCLEVMAGMGGGCVDHVITDPPYEAEAHTKARRSNPEAGTWRVDDYTIDFGAMTEPQRQAAGLQMARVSGGWILVFCQVEAAMTWRASMEPASRYIRTQIWRKPDGAPQFTGDRPGMGYESIVTMWGGDGRSRWNGGGRHGFYEHTLESRKQPRAATKHPTIKPLSLIMELVSLFTDPDDLILDPFCGSGTTGGAALKLGRRVILIEKDPKYAEIARQRMQDTEEEIAAEGGEVRSYSKPRQAGLFAKR